jgi:hypothetical protein
MQLNLNKKKSKRYYLPVIIPLSDMEYSTHNIGPAWQARTASHVPRETDHTLAVQSSLPVISVSPTILIDLHDGQTNSSFTTVINSYHKQKKNTLLSSPNPFCVA